MADPKPPETLVEGSGTLPSGGLTESESRYAKGDHIAGRYEVIDVVGEGATAVVYRVFDHGSQEEVAVKIIDDVEGGIEKLRHEVRLARKVTHPNVCRVFDIVEHRHGAMLSMELAGGTLLDETGQPHSDRDVRELAAQILDGLEAAHDAGVLHRDLKPANVLVGDGGVLKLTDFGVAHPAIEVTATEDGPTVGTPAYMAPEQLEGEAVDRRTDIYAVGLILYELIAGRLPFVAEGTEMTLAAALKRIDRDIPRLFGSSLDAPIRQMLAREPGQRPSSADEARALLGITPEPGRKRWVLAAIALVAIAAAAATWSLRGSNTTERALVQPKTRALTGAEEQIADAATFTPDGTSLVIATDRRGRWQLWRISIDEAMQRQLTSGTQPARAPQIAGEHLHYLRGRDLVRVPVARVDGDRWGDEVGDVLARGVHRYHISRSGRVALVRSRSPRVLELIEPSGQTRVLSRAAHPIGSPRWSPDETHIAWGDRPWGTTSDAAIYMIEIASGEKRRLTSAAGFTGLTWLPDGRSLALIRGVGEQRALWRLDIESRRLTALARGLRDAALPTVAPDGRLAYVVDTWSYVLWMYERERLSRMTYLGDEAVVSPHWVHDRDELIYGVSRPDRTGLELRRLTGPTFTDVTAVKTIAATHSSLAISADGAIVVYTARDAGQFVMRRSSMTGRGDEVELRRSPRQLLALQILSKGRVSYFDDASTAVWDMKLDGTDPRKLVSGGGGFHSYDGKWMAFSGSRSPTGVWVQAKDASGMPTGEATPAPGDGIIYNTRWHPTTGELITAERSGLFAIDPNRRSRRRLARWPPGTREPDKLAVHPDGRVACSLAMGRSSIKVIDNFAALRR